MFLVEALVVVTVVFWVSATVSEAVLSSPEERLLPAFVRVGFGYMFTFAFMAAAWKFISVGQAWMLGLALLAIYLLSLSNNKRMDVLSHAKGAFRSYFKAFAWCLVGANLFFLPLHMGRNYGPFTEGGGDISIYADAAKYLADHSQPAYGIDDIIYDASYILKNSWEYAHDNLDSIAHFDPVAGNPPTPNHSAYRVAVVQIFSSAWLIPSAMWFFLANKTNYHIYFGVIAFEYSCLLASIWFFFRRFGFFPAVIGLSLVASSHGLVSVYYNGYYMQGMCLMLAALFLAALHRISVFSWAGIRSYGPGIVVMAASYFFFLPLVVPFLAVSIKKLSRWTGCEPLLTLKKEDKSRLRVFLGFLGYASALLVALILFFPMFVDARASFIGIALHRIREVVAAIFFGQKSVQQALVYLGDSIPLYSEKWLSFFFGVLSQQHFEPFMKALPSVTRSCQAAIFFAVVASFAGFIGWLMVFGVRANRVEFKSDRRYRFGLSVWVIGILCEVVYQILAQGTLYTQAKGSQNTLIALYTLMVIPSAILYGMKQTGKASKAVFVICVATLAIFILSMLVPRTILAFRIGVGADRSSVMEASFFSEADRIMKSDKEPFVWFEPETNGDIYLSNQPFVGAKQITSRHVFIIKEWVKPGKVPRVPHSPVEFEQQYLISYDFLPGADVNHFWTLEATRTERKNSLIPAGSFFRSQWRATRLVDLASPKLLLGGHNYESPFDMAARNPKETGVWSYLRNGGAAVYLPGGSACEIEAKIAPYGPTVYHEAVAEINDRAKKGEFDSSLTSVADDGVAVILRYSLVADPKPRIVRVARCKAEFLFNVLVNGKEIVNPK